MKLNLKMQKIVMTIFGMTMGLILAAPLAQASGALIQGVMVSPNPYSPVAGFLNLSYGLSNSSGTATINAGIYSQTNLDTPLKTWTFTSQSNGGKSLSWDGTDTMGSVAAEGDYVFTVGGSDNGTVIATQQANFKISNQTLVSTTCAGFTDINANDLDCPAVSYVKSIGAMTGTSKDIFAPHALLQRDQVIKIVLQTFKKFDSAMDYCKGAAPFPDVVKTDWSFQYLCRAKELGVTTGYQSGPDKGFYRPVRSVTRSEFLALVLRNLTDAMPKSTQPTYADVPQNDWYTVYAKYAYDNTLFNKPNLFPGNFMTREEVARVIFKLHQLGKL